MTWTLHKYIARDLLKKGLLALVVFTLVMTTLGVIEPMRRYGLSPAQVFRLFWYLLPVMLSLTLPIAALLAATMVYGRLSMDNELTACLAGGIGVHAVLRPAMAMGALVSALTLLLSNWIAPALAIRGERMGQANVRGLVYQRLRSAQFMEWERQWLIHADRADDKTDLLEGVVAVRRDGQRSQYFVASQAMVRFENTRTGADVWVELVNPAAGRRDRFDISSAQRMPLGPYHVDSPIRDLPMLYDWPTLIGVWQDPERSPIVQAALEEIRRHLRAGVWLEQAAERVLAEPGCELFYKDAHRYRFRAPAAQRRRQSLFLTAAATATDRAVFVGISSVDGAGDETLIRCARAELRAMYVPELGRCQVTAILTDVLEPPARPGEEPMLKAQYVVGPLELPDDSVTPTPTVSLRQLKEHPEDYPGLADKIAKLTHEARKLSLRVLGEINSRMSYGVGCLLLVAAGAALGLLFKGGNVLSAFALSCLPAMMLIAVTAMGKQLIRNSSVSWGYGVAAIWSGVALLGGITFWLHGVVLRRRT